MKRAFLLCVLVVAMAVLGAAQKAPPTLHVTTHLVQVNVIVLDHQGHPVRGLRRKDFRVYDNGKQQPIAVFREESSRPPAVPLPKLPPNAFSNWAARAGYAPSSVTAILLDPLNTSFVDRHYAHKAVLKFLEQLRPNDRVALYYLGRHLVVLHDFTSNVAPLVAAIRHYQGHYVSEIHGPFEKDSAMSGESTLQVPGGQTGQSDFSRMFTTGATPDSSPSAGPATQFSQLEAELSSIGSLQSEYIFRRRIAMTVDALVAIANHLKALPGRKNLIWVSAGFPMWQNLEEALRPGEAANMHNLNSSMARAARALNNVNVAIYPVDARGVIADPNFGSGPHGFSRNIPDYGDSISTMAQLADRTGGHAFYNTNDIQGSIRRVLDDSKVTYVLAYYPKDVKWNGEFRKIRVRVNRKGLKLQYRHGYSAFPEKPVPASAGSQALAAVVHSPLDATGIGLVVQLAKDKKTDASGRPAFHMKYQVDPRDLKFKEEDGSRVASLTLVTDEFDPQGRTLREATQKIDLHMQPGIYQEALAKGMGFREPLQVPILYSGERLRVVIRDDSTGEMGSVNVPISNDFRPAKPTFTKRTARR